MAITSPSAPVPLSSAAAPWLTRAVPGLVGVLGGAVTAAAWLDLLGDAPAPLLVRWAVTGAWLLGSGVAIWWSGRFHQVWLDGDTLIVGDERRGVRVSLRDVREVDESRFQKVKAVVLRLSRPTPLGDAIRFIPRGSGSWLSPWASSPVAAMLRERSAALSSGREPPRALR
jgi:hypothetical protein